MKKEKLLLKYEKDCDDEFDVSCWQIVDVNEWNSLKDKFLEKFEDNEFGINEEILYENGSEFIDKIDIRVLTSDEVKIIKNIFKCTQMGSFDFIDIINFALESDEEYVC